MTKVFATVAALAAIGSSAARATDMKDFSYRCSPGAVRACASLQVYTTLNGSGGTNVIIRVRNLAGTPGWWGDNSGGSIITRIGIVRPPITGASVSGAALGVTAVGGASFTGANPASLWMLRDPGALGGAIELTAGITNAQKSGGIEGCTAPFGGGPFRHYTTCAAGSWIEFSFTTNNAWSALNSDVAWLYQNTANGNTEDECDSHLVPNRPWCQAVTPEPVTMLLLGSGLAGMGGFGFMRRRKNDQIDS